MNVRARWQQVLFLLPILFANPCAAESAEDDAAFFAPTPETDPFYFVDGEIPDEPGRVLKSREITYQPAGLRLANAAWQLLYVTRDVNGEPATAVTTAVMPLVPRVEPVLMSFQHAYDSLGPECTPSKTATGSTANQTNQAESLEYLAGLKSQGWTILIPDYEGVHHAWGAGVLSGQAVLDSIRAAISFPPLGLNPGVRVGLWGYSGGAFASAWAAALQPQYANDINLVGTVSGGTPVDWFDIVERTEHTSNFTFLFSSLIGMTREYPALLTRENLTDAGSQAVEALRDACVGAPAEGFSLSGTQMTDYVKVDKPYESEGFVETDQAVNLLQHGAVPKSDVFMFHETEDVLVPIEGAEALAGYWCEEGAPVHFYRSSAGPLIGDHFMSTHVIGAALGTPAAIAYLESRLSGAPVAVTPPGTSHCN